MEKNKKNDELKRRPPLIPGKPDEYGFSLGYSILPMQAIKKINTRSGSGLDNEFYSIEKLESMYLSCSDGLIGIQDGSITVDQETIGDNAKYTFSEFDGQPSDHVVYLDKSARPIQYLIAGLWDSLAKPSATKPEHSFVNIDKEIWLQQMNVPIHRLQNPQPEDYNFDNIDKQLLKDRINQLRAIYIKPEFIDQIDENNIESCKDLPTVLDGQNVLIVDEVESSGYTLKIALELYKRAFPNTKFGTAYWASPRKISWTVNEKDGTESKEFAASWVPFWYDSDTAYGRGIGDIDPVYSASSEDVRIRLGKFLLSAPINNQTNSGFEIINDTRSKQTYSDLDLIISRFHEGKILYKPSPSRLDFEKRAVEFNSLRSMDEYVAAVRSL
jgi:hypothetical protein